MPYRIDLLARHHRRLIEIVETAIPLITDDRANADLRGLRHLRQEITDSFDSYQRFLQEEVLARSIWSNANEACGDARNLASACQQLRQDYETFRARWTAEDTSQNWARYKLNARCMAQQVRDHIIDAAIMNKRWISSEAA